MNADKSRLGMLALLSMTALAACDVDLAAPVHGPDIDIDVDVDPPRYQASAPFSYAVPISGQALLRLEGVSGEVRFEGSEAAGQILVTGYRRARAHSQAEADASVADIDVRLSEGADEIVVASHHPRVSHRSYEVDYTITLPRWFDVRVDYINGPVTLEGMEGQATVALVNGSIGANMTLPRGGTIDLHTTNGGIDLQVQKDASARLTATVANGTITTSNLDLWDKVSSPHALAASLGEGEGLIRLALMNGDIEVRGR